MPAKVSKIIPISLAMHILKIFTPNCCHAGARYSVFSEGQITETCLCSRTFVISENCSRSNTDMFTVVFD